MAMYAAGLLGSALAAAVITKIMYQRGTTAGVGIVVALAGGAAVARRPMLGLYASVLAIPLELYGIRAGYQAITLSQLLLSLTAVVALGHMVFGGSREHVSPVHLWFLALIAVVLTGFFFAEDTTPVARVARTWVVFGIAAIYLSQRSQADIERFLTVLTFAGAYIGVAAILSAGHEQAADAGTIVAGRAEIGFGDPNVLGTFLALCFPVAATLAVYSGNGARRLLASVAAPVILIGMFGTLSRGAILGAAVALLILMTWKDLRRVLFAVLALILVAVAFNYNAIANSPQVTVVATRLNTVRVGTLRHRDPRLEIWKKTPAMIAANFWLGVGEGNFAVVSPRYGVPTVGGRAYLHAHDDFLTIAAELGIVGLAIFVGWLVSIFNAARDALRTQHRRWPLAIGVTASLGGVFAAGLVDYTFSNPVMTATVLLLTGALVGLRADRDAPSDIATA